MQAQRALVAMGLGPRCTSEPAKVLPRGRRSPSASVWLHACPCDPHNGKKRRAAAVKPAGRTSDAQLLALLRDARRPPLLPRVSPSAAWRCSSSRCGEAAPAARVPIRPLYPLRTASGGWRLAPATSSGRRGSSFRARGWGRAERPRQSAGREGDPERLPSAARRALPLDRPPPAGAALPRWRASRTCTARGAWEPAAAAAGSAPQQGPYLGGARALSRLLSPSGRRGGARSQPASPGRAPAPLRASPCWLPTLTPPHPAPGRNGCNGWDRGGR